MGAAAVVSCAPELAAARPRPEPSGPASSGWRAPVKGGLLRGFDFGADPFARGAHRGVDLVARPGTRVGSTCSGRVAFAGPVAHTRVVTVACGAWRVTHLPLKETTVAAGDAVRTGRKLGTVAAASAHAGLHLGVRRAGDRLGYVDPWPLLDRVAGDPRGPGIVPARRARPARRAPVPRRPRKGPRLPGTTARPTGDVPEPVVAPGVAPAPAVAARRPARDDRVVIGNRPAELAPPVAWLGLAMLLAAAARSRPRRLVHAIRLRAKEPATRAR